MTLRAFWTEAALVFVFMASDATGREAHPGVIQVFGCEQSAGRSHNVLRGVAGTAADAHVLAIEHISRFGVIESLWGWVPMEQVEVLTIVVGVAFYAGRTRGT